MRLCDAHAEAVAQFDVDECEEKCWMYARNDVEHVAAVVVVEPKSS